MATAIPRIYLAGEPDSPLPSAAGKPVDINEIRRTHNSSNLYQDPDFPPTLESIGSVVGDDAARSGKAGTGEAYHWMRPHAIATALGADRPNFAVVQDSNSGESQKLFSEYDLTQGALGDCWYIAALQALTRNQDQLRFVIPEDNITGFDSDRYCGAFHFRFFSLIDDKWVDVVVDDHLPVHPWGDSWRLVFAKASPKWSHANVTEFWGPLMEKAYAKFIGSYAKIEAGYSSHALENFTNGFAEIIDFTNPDTIYKLTSQRSLSLHDVMKRRIQGFIRMGTFMGIGDDDLMTAYENGRLEGFSDYVDHVADDGTLRHSVYGYKYDEASHRVVTDPTTMGLGLVCPHAYTVMDAREVRIRDGSGTLFLLKLRNPHATHEWLGAFGEMDDQNWDRLEQDLRQRDNTGSTLIDDGVFWMLLADALKYFRSLEVCSFGMDDGTRYAYERGVWPAFHQQVPITTDLSNCLKYCTAYKFEISRELTSLKVPSEFEGKCMIAVTVVLGGYYSGINPLPVFNYVLYKVSQADLAKPLEELYSNAEYSDAGMFNIGRDVSRWTFLEPGTYIIVPYLITEPDASGNIPLPREMIGKPVQYAIRLFTENETRLEPIPGLELEYQQ